MINFKKIFIMILMSMMLFSSVNAYAFITLDPTRGVGKIFVTISEGVKQVQEKVTDLQNKIKGQKWVQDGMNAVKYIKSTYKENKDMYRQYKRIYERALNSDAVVIARMQAEIASLDKSIEELTEQRNAIVKDDEAAFINDTTYIDEQIKILNENLEFYSQKDDEQSLAFIEKTNLEIKALEEEKAATQSLIEEASSSDLAVIDAQLNRLISQREDVKESLDRLIKTVVVDFLDDVKNLTLSQDLNFVRANEVMTSLHIEKIKKSREEERDKVVVEAFRKSSSLKETLSHKIAQRNVLINNADGLKETSANIRLLIESKLDDIDELFIYIETLILDLKLQTAVELADSNEYQTQINDDKSTEIFDLNDYVFDYQKYKDAQLSKKSLSLREFKNNIENVKNISENLNEEFLQGGMVEEWTDFGDRILNSENAGRHRLNNNVDNFINDTQSFKDRTKNQLENMVEDAAGIANDW